MKLYLGHITTSIINAGFKEQVAKWAMYVKSQQFITKSNRVVVCWKGTWPWKKQSIALFWMPVEKLAINQALEWSMAIAESCSRLQSHQRKMYGLRDLSGTSATAGNCLIVWKKNSLALGGLLKVHKSLLQKLGEGFICCRHSWVSHKHSGYYL